MTVLFYFTDAPLHVETLAFARALASELHARQRHRRQAGDEAVALPGREQVAGVVVSVAAGRQQTDGGAKDPQAVS
jgi:hypothetical protein